MLAPAEIATWIALCIPWAEPRLATALIQAGSGGEPRLVTTAAGERYQGSLRSALTGLRSALAAANSDGTLVGITQLAAGRLKRAGIDPEAVLGVCTNLQVGYAMLADAYSEAERFERSPWKRLSTAFNLYRSGRPELESEYSRAATRIMMQGTIAAPARPGDPIYHSVIAQWSAELALEHAGRNRQRAPGPIDRAHAMAAWARRGVP